MDELETTNSHLDRLLTTGPLPRQVAFDEGASGPIKRASGIQRDLRISHPYAAYSSLSMNVPVRTEGDAHARSRSAWKKIRTVDLIYAAVNQMPNGPVATDIEPPRRGEGLARCESTRGSITIAVHLDDEGRLARAKVKSPSFSNWNAFQFTANDSNMMDYAINEASFGLTIAGCDRRNAQV